MLLVFSVYFRKTVFISVHRENNNFLGDVNFKTPLICAYTIVRPNAIRKTLRVKIIFLIIIICFLRDWRALRESFTPPIATHDDRAVTDRRERRRWRRGEENARARSWRARAVAHVPSPDALSPSHIVDNRVGPALVTSRRRRFGCLRSCRRQVHLRALVRPSEHDISNASLRRYRPRLILIS